MGKHPATETEAAGQQSIPSRDSHILGLPTTELAGLSVDELMGNKVAITMMLHYYKQLVDENSSLRNEVNTLKTYVDSYSAKKINSSVGAALLFLSNILIGFGVNLLTNKTTWPGLASFFPGIGLAFVGLYFSLREGK